MKDASDLLNYIRSLNPPPAPAQPSRTIAALTPGDR
jgi:hypothetical protein